MAKDMTTGSLTKTLIKFSLPLIMSGLLQQLYSWVDAFVVGNFEGESALAAIGATNVLSQFFIFAITGFTSGVSILSARYYGDREKSESEQSRILSSFMVVLGSVCTVTAFLFFVFSDGILNLLDTPEDIFDIAKGYLEIILFGVPFLAVYNVYSAVLRGMGDSSAPFYSVLVSAVTNVVLDILFVAVLGYGARGAAVATVIAQSAMTVFIIIYSHRTYECLRIQKGQPVMYSDILSKGCRLSLPITVQSLANATGNLVLQNFMNSFGTVTVAAITTAYRIDSVILLPIINLGTGIATIVAQNVGAGAQKRAKESLYAGLRIMLVVSVILAIIVLSFAGDMIEMFGVEAEGVSIGREFFRRFAPFYIIFGTAMAMRGYREGVGDVIFSGANSIFALLIRIVLSYTLRPVFGNMVIAYAEGISWTFMLILYALRYFAKRNSDIKQL